MDLIPDCIWHIVWFVAADACRYTCRVPWIPLALPKTEVESAHLFMAARPDKESRQSTPRVTEATVRTTIRLLNSLALVSRAWFQAIQWATLYRRVGAIFANNRHTNRLRQFLPHEAIGKLSHEEYHAALCSALAIPGRAREYWRWDPASGRLRDLARDMLARPIVDATSLLVPAVFQCHPGPTPKDKRFGYFISDLAPRVVDMGWLGMISHPEIPGASMHLRRIGRLWDTKARAWVTVSGGTPMKSMIRAFRLWKKSERHLLRVRAMIKRRRDRAKKVTRTKKKD